MADNGAIDHVSRLFISFTIDQWSNIATIVSVFVLGVLGAVVPFVKSILKKMEKKKKDEIELQDKKTKTLIKEVKDDIDDKLGTIAANQERQGKTLEDTLTAVKHLTTEVSSIKTAYSSVKAESDFMKNILIDNLGLKHKKNLE